MKHATDRQKLQYMKAVAREFERAGYIVEKPTLKHDLLDVWGFAPKGRGKRRRRCFIEIYLHTAVFETKHGLYGVWGHGEHDDAEVEFNPHDGYVHSYDDLIGLVEDLEPIKQRKGG